jgi:hypothetical protein
MTDISDEIDDPRISERLHDVLTMIMCPIAGCWSLHGAETVMYYDEDTHAYVLEAWPVGVEQPEEHAGNGHAADGEFLYEFAEFDFLELVKQVPLKQFHFSQRDAIFEIGWPEFGHDLELRVHIEPAVRDGDD